MKKIALVLILVNALSIIMSACVPGAGRTIDTSILNTIPPMPGSRDTTSANKAIFDSLVSGMGRILDFKPIRYKGYDHDFDGTTGFADVLAYYNAKAAQAGWSYVSSKIDVAESEDSIIYKNAAGDAILVVVNVKNAFSTTSFIITIVGTYDH
jgi:predicted small secreted protein